MLLGSGVQRAWMRRASHGSSHRSTSCSRQPLPPCPRWQRAPLAATAQSLRADTLGTSASAAGSKATNPAAWAMSAMGRLLGNTIQGRMNSVPIPMLLLLVDTHVTARQPLPRGLLAELCSAWQSRLADTTATQSLQLLDALATLGLRVQPQQPAQSQSQSLSAEAALASPPPVPRRRHSGEPGAAEQERLEAGWLADVCMHVADSAATLSGHNLITYLTASWQLGWKPTPTNLQPLVQLAAAVTSPQELVRVLPLLARWDCGRSDRVAEPLSQALHRLHATLDTLDPLAVLGAYVAASSLGVTPLLSHFRDVCIYATARAGQLPANQVVVLLSSVAQCAVALHLDLQSGLGILHTASAHASTPSTPASVQGADSITSPDAEGSAVAAQSDRPAAQRALRELVTATATALLPQLPQLQPAQLVAVASALQQLRWQQQPDLPSVGMGAGAHGPIMVNSYPVTVIHPTPPGQLPRRAVTEEPAGTITVVHSTATDPTATTASTIDPTTGPLPQQASSSSASGGASDSSSGTASASGAEWAQGSRDGPSFEEPQSKVHDQAETDMSKVEELLRALHQAAIAQLDAFADGDQLADFLRPMVAMRAQPPRTMLAQLAQDMQASGQAYAAMRRKSQSGVQESDKKQPQKRSGQEEPVPAAAMSHHGLCMALFVFSALGYSGDRAGLLDNGPLAAAQQQLAPIMASLSPSDLTNATWAFACLDKQHRASGGSVRRRSRRRTVSPTTRSSESPAVSSASGSQQETGSDNSSPPGSGEDGSGDGSGGGSGGPSPSRSPQRSRTLADIAAANTANASSGRGSALNPPKRGPYSEYWMWAAARTQSDTDYTDDDAAEDTAMAGAGGWLRSALAAVGKRVEAGQLVPHQLAFVLGSLERVGAEVPGDLMDKILGSFQAQLPAAKTGDTVLVLATVARLGHVTSYAWMEEIVEHHLAGRMEALTAKELATVSWSLAKLHHRPSPEFMIAMVDAVQEVLSSATVDNLATFVWSVAELAPDTPVTLFMDALCEELRPRLSELVPRDLVSVLAAMARLRYQPSAEWLSEWLRTLDYQLAFVDGEGYAQIISALAVLDTRVTNSAWWGRFLAQMCTELPHMDSESLLTSAVGMAFLKVPATEQWKQAFTKAVEQRCSMAARGWGQTPSDSDTAAVSGVVKPSEATPLTAQQHELLLTAQLQLGVQPGPRQVADLELQLAGVSALRQLGPERLVRLVGSLAGAAATGADLNRYTPLPRLAWLDGPLVEGLRAALPDLTMLHQSQLTKALGLLLEAIDARAAVTRATDTTDTTTSPTTSVPDTIPSFSDATPSSFQLPQPSATTQSKLPALRNLLAYLREFYLYNG